MKVSAFYFEQEYFSLILNQLSKPSVVEINLWKDYPWIAGRNYRLMHRTALKTARKAFPQFPFLLKEHLTENGPLVDTIERRRMTPVWNMSPLKGSGFLISFIMQPFCYGSVLSVSTDYEDLSSVEENAMERRGYQRFVNWVCFLYIPHIFPLIQLNHLPNTYTYTYTRL